MRISFNNISMKNLNFNSNEPVSKKDVILNAIDLVDIKRNKYSRKCEDANTFAVMCLGMIPMVVANTVYMGVRNPAVIVLSMLAGLGLAPAVLKKVAEKKQIVEDVAFKEELSENLDINKSFAQLNESQIEEKNKIKQRYVYISQDEDKKDFYFGTTNLSNFGFLKNMKEKQIEINFSDADFNKDYESDKEYLELINSIQNKINSDTKKYKNKVETVLYFTSAILALAGLGIRKACNFKLVSGSRETNRFLKSVFRDIPFIIPAAIGIEILTSSKFQENIDKVGRYKSKESIRNNTEPEDLGFIGTTLDYFKNKKKYLEDIEKAKEDSILNNVAVKQIKLTEKQEKDAEKLRLAFNKANINTGKEKFNYQTFVSIFLILSTFAVTKPFNLIKYVGLITAGVSVFAGALGLVKNSESENIKNI